MAAVLLLIPALLAACATENKSETVIVTTDEPEEVLVDESVDANALEKTEWAYREALEKLEKLNSQQETHVVYEELAEQERALAQRQLELEKQAREQYRRLQEQERMEEERYSVKRLQRLELQMTYLQSKIKEVSETLDKLRSKANGGNIALGPMALRGEYELIEQRLHLLNRMYMQRMEDFETLKMEQFTKEALADNG